MLIEPALVKDDLVAVPKPSGCINLLGLAVPNKLENLVSGYLAPGLPLN
jgi:hypothetical protein